jgi:nucleoside-diphosphate-sugar epimerase
LKVLLIGFGDIARRLVPLLKEDYRVSGLRRSAEEVEGVTMLKGDCTDPAILASALSGQDAVVVTLTPQSFTEAAYREAYVKAAQALVAATTEVSNPPRRILWVSSTSVYGQHQGEWVDEASPTHPAGFSGQCLLEAENILERGAVAVTVVRFSGIYGRGQPRLIEQVRSGRCAPEKPVVWTNRIHGDDCAGVLHHLLERQRQGLPLDPCYVATDCEPSPLAEVQRWLAAQLGVACQIEESTAARRGNRRCSNKRLLATGYQFLYPDYRKGYGALLKVMV